MFLRWLLAPLSSCQAASGARGIGLAVLLAVSVLGGIASSPGMARAGDLSGLPRLEVAEREIVPLPTDGVRGLIVSGSSLILLADDHRGLSAPDSSYLARLLRFQPSTGEVELLAAQRDAFETGLTGDGQAWWSCGSLLGADGGINRISPEDGSILSSLPLPGHHPGGIAFDGSYLWVVDCDARKLLRVEVEEGLISRKVATPSLYPTGLAYDGYHFWCADATTGRIYRLKGYNGRVDAVLSREAFYRPGAFVSLAWGAGALWAVTASDSFALRMKLAR